MVLITREVTPPPFDSAAKEQRELLQLLTQVTELAKTAHEIFSNLANETSVTFQRVTKLSHQLVNTSQMVASVETSSKQRDLEVILKNGRTQWSAGISEKSQLFVGSERPNSIEALRVKASPPPCLQKLDSLMDGGVSALSLYTNPNFFIDEWVAEQLRMREEAKKARRERRRQRAEKKKEEGPKEAPVEVTKLKITKYDPVTGEKILVDAPTSSKTTIFQAMPTSSIAFKRKDSTLDLESPPSEIVVPYRDAPEVPQSDEGPGSPPLPPSQGFQQQIPSQMYQQTQNPQTSMFNAPSFGGPPPPPPPGPPPPPVVAVDLDGSGFRKTIADAQLKSVGNIPAKKHVDERSNLMEAIKKGINLKTTDKPEPTEKKPEENSVAAILSRRIAIVGDSDEDEEEDDNDWD